MATQYFKRNLLLNLYREGKRSLVCFLLPLKREKNVWHLQPTSSIWRPLAFLPVTVSRIPRFRSGRERLLLYEAGLCPLSAGSNRNNKLPPSRIIQERSQGERSCQFIWPTNLPESLWLESIWLSNACAIRKDQVRMTSQRQPGK